jgi:hypothetical protein
MNFPISMYNLYRFAEELQAEGFDAYENFFNGQVGLVVGPTGLDPERLPSGQIGFFLPLWEINAQTNRLMIARRQFHDLVESRPKGWEFNKVDSYPADPSSGVGFPV